MLERLKMLIEGLNNGNKGLNLTLEDFETNEKAKETFFDTTWKYYIGYFQGILGKQIKCPEFAEDKEICVYNRKLELEKTRSEYLKIG